MRFKSIRFVISIALILVMVYSFSINVFAASVVYCGTCGDVNEDGKMDMRDVLIIEHIIAKSFHPTVGEFGRADINQDSIVDSRDVQLYRQYIAEYEVTDCYIGKPAYVYY